MKIVTSTATRDGYQDSSRNNERIAAACELIEQSATVGARLVVLPGGFLSAAPGSERSTGKAIVKAARRCRLAVAFGVDTRRGGRSKQAPRSKSTRRTATDAFPYFVVGLGTDGKDHAWQQRSTTRWNGWSIGPDDPERRFLNVDGERVDVLACGEVFSRTLRAACVAWGARVIVSPFHTASRSRFFHAVAWAQQHRIRCVRAVHAVSAELGVARAASIYRDSILSGWLVEF